MGALLSIPFLGSLGGVATSALAGLALCFTSSAASLAFKSCNCNSSIATRVGFALIFSLNSMLAWLMKTPWAIKQLQRITYDYIQVECRGGKCYGVLAVHRICFALSLFHLILSLFLIGVKDTRTKRAALQNGWWGPKVLVWVLLIVITFFIPNEFFVFWGDFVAPLGSVFFIIIGLILLIDFAHSWTETCLNNWENDPSGSNLWQWILVGSTATLYAVVIALTGVMYGFFASEGCTLNRFFITFNWILCVLITLLCVHPAIQEANPKSGLAQASMVAAYCTYLIMSAVGNHTHASCNPLHNGGATKTTTVVVGGIFTFVAIAYSTTRAATQSKALTGKGNKKLGDIRLEGDEDAAGAAPITTQPTRKDTPRYQALVAAVEAGAIPASALNSMQDQDSDEEDGGVVGEERDDERTGTRYNYTWFHAIFAVAAMYIAMLLTDWQYLRMSPPSDGGESPDIPQDIYIGRSEIAMWMRVVSSWASILLYSWSLVAPIVLPDRFGDWD